MCLKKENDYITLEGLCINRVLKLWSITLRRSAFDYMIRVGSSHHQFRGKSSKLREYTSSNALPIEYETFSNRIPFLDVVSSHITNLATASIDRKRIDASGLTEQNR